MVSNHSGMQGKNRRAWRLLIVGTVLFFLVAGVYFLLDSTRESKRLEQNLIDRFGWADDYTPAIDGAVPAPRVEAFIRVRKAMQPACTRFQQTFNDVLALEKMEDDEQVSSRDQASAGIRGFKSMLSTPGQFLTFMDTRNTKLMEEEMGLGEYLYLYVSAYGEQLAGESESRYADAEEAFISPRARKEFTQILENQLAALKASEPRESQNPQLVALAGELEREIAALNSGTHVSPWPDGAIGMTRDSLAPYREQITALYCTGIVRIELQQKNRGFNFDG